MHDVSITSLVPFLNIVQVIIETFLIIHIHTKLIDMFRFALNIKSTLFK